MIKTTRRFFKFIVAALFLSCCCLAIIMGGESRKKNQSPSSVPGWEVIGLGGGGGIFLPTISPFDPNMVLTPCDMTGAYLTFDGGKNWLEFNLWTVPSDFQFDPVNANVIYIASRGYLHSEDRGAGHSLIFCSTDRGKRWRIIYPDPAKTAPGTTLKSRQPQPFETPDGMLNGTIEKIRIDPLNNRKLYLRVAPLISYMENSVTQNRSLKLLVSTNRGGSWTLLAEITGARVLQIFPGSIAGRADEGRLRGFIPTS